MIGFHVSKQRPNLYTKYCTQSQSCILLYNVEGMSSHEIKLYYYLSTHSVLQGYSCSPSLVPRPSQLNVTSRKLFDF